MQTESPPVRSLAHKPVFMPTAVLLGDSIYLFGGEVNEHYSVDDIWEYKISRNKWTLIGQLPEKLSNIVAVTHGQTIFLIGGTTLKGPEEKNYYRSVFANSSDIHVF